jgi:hypothetical protein
LTSILFKFRSGSVDMHWTVDPLIDGLEKTKIPYEPKGLRVDKVSGRVTIPVKAPINSNDLDRLRANLPAWVLDIEIIEP